MQFFRKKLFLQKIKEQMPELSGVKLKLCEYLSYKFSEWLSFEYGNYRYMFYHAQLLGTEMFKCSRRLFNAFEGRTSGPLEIQTLSLAS